VFLSLLNSETVKNITTRIEAFNLLDDRELELYNDLLKSGVKVLKRIHKAVPGIPGSETDSPIEPKLIEIVTYSKEG
jgi:hypothetical protein